MTGCPDDVKERLGLVQVYTGNGKGKTTCALGLAMRARGCGLRVAFLQFLKPEAGYGEQAAARELGIDVFPMGADHIGKRIPEEETLRLTRLGMEKAETLITSGEYDLVVLDEINNSLKFSHVTSDEVIRMLDRRAPHTEVVLTGRGAPQEIMDYADLVTEMRLVKHPMDRGVPARRGIEYRGLTTAISHRGMEGGINMPIYNSITETIGDTPLVRLNRMAPPGSHVYVKVERCNPSGSIKDRAALSIIDDAIARGVLREGGTIIEPTSGNMGIGLAMIAAARGLDAVIVMPDTMTKERISLMRAYGAEVVLSPGAEGMQGAVDMAERIAEERGGFVCGQFDNPANTAAHRTGTGPEILRDLPDVDLVYAGFGTGGTATGIAQCFLDVGSKARVIGIEPAESPLVTDGRASSHGIQGIGANFVPGNLDASLLGGVETVGSEDAVRTAVELCRKEGVFCGISSGANVFAAIRAAKEHPEKRIVAILPDGGDRYLSTGMFDE